MSWLRWTLMVAICLQFTFAAEQTAARAAEEKPKEEKAAKAPDSTPKLDQAALEKQFAEKMNGAVFSGHYSVNGKGNDKPPQMEKYTISSARKLSQDFWLLTARIQYGEHDLSVPMSLQVKWAGDTPMITLTDLTIPGLGTFTSRVLIYDDMYAGTWQHGKVGGHLWGRIEKAAKEEKGEPKKGDAKK